MLKRLSSAPATTTDSMKKILSNPWPYAIILYFCIFITAIGVFIAWAVRQKMDLVRHDYYADEMLFQGQIDAVSRTAPLKDQVSLRYDASAKKVELALPPSHISENVTGRLRLYRPSDANLDRDIAVRLNAQGKQQIDVATLKPGLWKAQVSWTAAGQNYFYAETLFIGAGAL